MEPTQRYHAACEECRGRKLKCSGHRPQCDRCKKDQVVCEYSLQKKMGRPRKSKINTATSPKLRNKLSTKQTVHSYTTPEPAVQSKDIYYHEIRDDNLPEWVPLFGDDFDALPQMAHSEIHHSATYELTWSPREEAINHGTLDGHSYDFGGIQAPIPVAQIQNHLPESESPDLQTHCHVPRIHISGSPNGSVSFDYPSPSFTISNHILGQSPPLVPAPPVSIDHGSPATALPLLDTLAEMAPHQPCECIFNFLMSITLLKTHIMKSPIPFQSAISTSRSAIATATYSLSCPSCQNDRTGNIFGNDTECISDMFLGALLPMLCIFYTKALESIEGTNSNQKVQIDGQEMDIELETWKEMARVAMVKEASRVNRLVDAMGKLSVKKNNMLGGAFCYSADVLWEPLCARLFDIARNAKQGNMERVFADNIGVC